MHPDSDERKILVVADESDTRIFICNLLTTFGCDPVGAANMVEGLEVALTQTPALIILDLMMADKAGIQMYLHLKNDEILKNVPVIVLSAIDRKTFSLYTKFKAIQKGAGVPEPDAYLEKPPEADDLMQQVHVLLAADAGKTDGPVPEKEQMHEGDEHPG